MLRALLRWLGIGTGDDTSSEAVVRRRVVGMAWQAVGAGDERISRSLARQGLVLAGVIAIPLTIAGVLLAGPVIGLFGLEPKVDTIAVDYWRISAFALPAMTGMFVASAILRGSGD